MSEGEKLCGGKIKRKHARVRGKVDCKVKQCYLEAASLRSKI